MALPQLYASCLLYRLVSVWCLKRRAVSWLNCHGRLDHQIQLWAECGVSFCAQRGEPYRSQATVWGHGGADYGRIQLRVELYYD